MHAEQEPYYPSFNTQLNLKESWEVNSWCEELNLRADELKEIVQKVGSNIHAIREYLAKRSLKRESPFY